MEEEGRLDILERKLADLERKLDLILDLLNKDVKHSASDYTRFYRELSFK